MNAVTGYASGIQYAPHGGVSQMTLGNGVVETTGYNSRLQPTSIAAGSLLSLGFGYGTTSNNGNLLSQTIAHLNNATQYYGYDGVNRISSFTEGSLTRNYSYDRYGNRWVSAWSGISPSSLTPQAQTSFDATNNQLTGVNYDGSGNQSVMGGYGLVYDAMGQLAAEYSTQANPDSGRRYLTMDHLGSTRLVTNAAGGVAKRYDYLPFGEGIFAGVGARTTAMHYESSAAPDAFNPKFTGKERDAEAISSASSSGLDYFGARYYAGAQGRWTTPDWSSKPEPVPYANPENPQTLNLYAYVQNNPLTKRDLDGHLICLAAYFGRPCETIVRPPPPKRPPPPPPPAARSATTLVPSATPQAPQQFTFRPGVPQPNGQLQTLVQCIGECARTPLTVTSTSEHVEGAHGPNTPHRRGEAADLRARSPQEADRLVGCAGNCGAGFALNEVRHPSSHATGPHVHVQVGPGLGGSRGDLPARPQHEEDE